MKKVFVLIVTICIFLTSCNPFDKYTVSNQESSMNILTTEESISDDKTEASGRSFVEELAYKKAEEIGMLKTTNDEAIMLAYEYIITNVYFNDPVGLDVWRYVSDEESAITFIENRSLSPLMFDIGSCEDFAAVMVMLLRAKGLEAEYVAGYTLSVDQVYIDHAWAVVKLDGNWYHLDPQLEQNIVKTGQLRYRYFMRMDETMEFDHKWGQNLVDYWSHIPQYEKDNILSNYSVPVCDTIYTQPNSKAIKLPAKPNLLEVLDNIEAIKKNSGKDYPLTPIYLNVDPPVLVSEYHITPPLLPQYYAEETPFTQQNSTKRYGVSLLHSDKLELYKQLNEYLRAPYEGDELVVSQRLTNDEIKEVINLFFDDYPEYYWANIEPTAESSYHKLVFTFKDDLTWKDVQERKDALNHYTNELLKSTSSLNDFEKALLIHDTIGSTVFYDTGYKIKDSGNAYGALIDKFAYCDGYARAFQYLANFAGIENMYIRGRDLKGTTHAWNAVKLGGNWYYVDVTWDRATNSYDGAYHDFFCVSFDDIMKERIWDDSQYPSLPQSESDEYNFYIKNNYAVFLDSGTNAYENTEQLADMFHRQLSLKNNLESDYLHAIIEVKIFGDHADYLKWKDSFNKNVFNILKETEKIAEETGADYSVSYDTKVSVYFNDSLQTLSFYPKVKSINR